MNKKRISANIPVLWFSAANSFWEDNLGFFTLRSDNYKAMEDKTLQSIKELLQENDEVRLAIMYGSASENRQTLESDLDLAVAGKDQLSSASMMKLIEELALIAGRPIDLVDLQTTHGPLLKQILSKGEVILKEDATLYGEIIKRMIFAEVDFMPYYNRILKERREKWINN